MPDSRSSAGSGRARLALRLGLGALALAALLGLGRAVGAYVPAFAEWVASLGPWGPLAFILGYVIAVAGFVPGSILTLSAGAVFGLVEGVAIVFVAAVIGSALAFLIARHVARRAVERHIAANPRFAALDRAIASDGRRIVFLLRLSPAFPFSFLNYGLGLTRVSFADYMAASIGMLPGTLLYVYYGHVLGTVAAVAGGAKVEKGLAGWVLLVVGLAATIGVTTLVTRTARRALAEATVT